MKSDIKAILSNFDNSRENKGSQRKPEQMMVWD
jgi:hypothetical protein